MGTSKGWVTDGWTKRAVEAATSIRTRVGLRPEVGLILGSGLGGLADEVGEATAVPYAALPYFPHPSVPGHAGRLVLGWLAGKPVAALVGRIHCYEGYSPQQVVFPTRVLAQLGCQTLIVTNAAGGLNPDFVPGDLMLIADHLNLPGMAGMSPLVGPEEGFGTRFVDLNAAYAPELLATAAAVAERQGIMLRQGIYAFLAGPHFETPAEVRFLRSIGADAVGMSTVPEVVAARQAGLQVLGVSCITNVATGQVTTVSHLEVLDVAAQASPRLAGLIKGVLMELKR